MKNCDRGFDIIFIDPPYANGLYEIVLESISKNKILNKNGLIVIEKDMDLGPVDLFNDSFEVFKEKKYGRVGITVLKWR